MRKLVIILAIFAISFVAVLVYGVGRDRSGGSGTSQKKCGGAPKMNGDEVDEDAMESWCPPDFMAKFDGIAGRFSKGIKIDQPRVSLAGNDAHDSRSVRPAKNPPDPKGPPRFVKLELTSGSAAKITASQFGKDAQTLCLCRPGNPISSDAMDLFRKGPACSDRWLAAQAGMCQPHDAEGNLTHPDQGKLTFGPLGGTLDYISATAAVVTAK